jgi:non-canonical purine NTP pyrophosphatase, rdgB/HAM1 family
VIATRNEGKAAEIRMLLGSVPFELLSLSDFDRAGEAEEPEDTYAGNAKCKAQYYSLATGEMVLADDSGLEVKALEGKPGVLSARYAGPNATDNQRRRKLLNELATINSSDRRARFVCAVAVSLKNGIILKVTEGICEGLIGKEPRGDSGFGYDPIFVPSGYTQTFGELAEEVKNQISHRARAIALMREFLLTEKWSA